MPEIREPLQQRAIEKKRRIIEAASRLFAEHGYQGTNAKQIAHEAGVAVGTFYNYFKDKKTLLVEVAFSHGDEVHAMLRKRFERMDLTRPGYEIMRELIVTAFESHRYSPELHREALALKFTDLEIRELSEQMDQGMLAAILEFLQSLKPRLRVSDHKAAATVVFQAIEAVVHEAVIFDAGLEAERLINALAEMTSRYLFDD
jgi:AcrR family transcriptional regulator